MKKERNAKKVSLLITVIGLIIIAVLAVYANIAGTLAETWKARVQVQSLKVQGTNGNTKKYFQIIVEKDGYTGFCIDGGGRLGTSSSSFNVVDLNSNEGKNVFKNEAAWHSALWMADNAYVSEMKSDLTAEEEQTLKTEMKDNLKQILNSKGKTQSANAIDGLSDLELVAAQNCVFWSYCKNTNSFYNNVTISGNQTLQTLVTDLKSIADENSSYVSQRAEIEIVTESGFEINTTTAKAGNFKVTGVTSIDANDLIVKVNGTEISNFTIETVSTDNDSVSFKINIPSSSLNIQNGETNVINVKYKYISTSAKILENNGKNQYLLAISKEYKETNGKGEDAAPIFDVALVKTISGYKSPNDPNRTIWLDRFDEREDVNTAPLKAGKNHAIYNVSKTPVHVINNSTIIYDLYVFNEGELDAKITELADYIPTCMTVESVNQYPFVNYIKIEKDSSGKNKVYTDSEGNKYHKYYFGLIDGMVLNIPGYDRENDKISFGKVSVQVKVTNDVVTQNVILRNFAEITGASCAQNVNDIDSTPKNLENLKVAGKGEADFNAKVSSCSDWKNLYKVDYLIGSKYNFEDDDDFEQIVLTNPKIDLALRKFISTVEDQEGNITNYDETREPTYYGLDSVDSDLTVKQLQNYTLTKTTMEYVHSKETVEVNVGDVITYKIRVYNEGLPFDYNGYATQIIDTLPDGIVINKDLTKTANENAGNNWIDWDNSDIENGNTIIFNALTDSTESIMLNKGLYNTLKYYAETLLNKDLKFYQEVIVVCNVTENVEKETTLINTASIGGYAYFNDVNAKVEVTQANESTLLDNLLDKDSDITINELSSLDNLINHLLNYDLTDWYYVDTIISNYGKNSNSHALIKKVAEAALKLINETPHHYTYVRGIQDDDDFESVIVRLIENEQYKLEIAKVDLNNTPIENIKFNVSVDDGEANEKITNRSGRAEIVNTENIGTSEANFANVHKVAISEITDDNQEYIAFEDTIYLYYTFDVEGKIRYTLKITNDPDYVDIDSEAEWNDFLGVNGETEILNIRLADGTTLRVKVSTNNNLVTVRIENKRIEGQYKLDIDKVDSEGNLLSGGEFVVEKNGRTHKNDGYDDAAYEYSIENVGWSYHHVREIQAPEGYIRLDEDLGIWTYAEVVNGKYQITKIGFSKIDVIDMAVDPSEVVTNTIYYLDDTEVEVELSASMVAGIITVKLEVPNKKMEGEYAFKLRKVDMEGNAIQGVGFAVSCNGEEIQLPDTTDVDGYLPVANKQITASGTDVYEISEIAIDNKYVKLQEPVVINIVKANMGKKYGVPFVYISGTPGERTKEVLLEDGITKVVVSVTTVNGEIILTIPNKEVEFDLSLEKFITELKDGETTTEIKDREPAFSKDENVTQGDGYVYKPAYEDLKPVEVMPENIVTYTLRVYNEGDIDGYASEISDDVPEGLEFVPYTQGDGSVNDTYRWVMYKVVSDEEIANLPEGIEIKEIDGDRTEHGVNYIKCIETADASEADYVSTDYLSKQQGEVRMTAGDTINPNLIKAFDLSDENALVNGPDYKEVKIQLKVVYRAETKSEADNIIINKAQITEDTDFDGNDIDDRDSNTNVWIEGEDDQDREKVKVNYFDLSLVKWVSDAIIVEDGVEKVSKGNSLEELQEPNDHRLIYAMYPDTIGEYTDLEPVIKVDIPKNKLTNIVVKFKYQIRVSNEGQIDGYAKEITDYIPTGMKFVKEDNPLWEEIGDGKVVTTQLADKLLKVGGEPETIEIIYTWINSEDNLGLIVNMAEISEDYNEFDSPDVDSTPDNITANEDDIDDAAVLLSVRTGDLIDSTYIILAVAVVALIATGVILIKKFV